jgi:hypothetical protein
MRVPATFPVLCEPMEFIKECTAFLNDDHDDYTRSPRSCCGMMPPSMRHDATFNIDSNLSAAARFTKSHAVHFEALNKGLYNANEGTQALEWVY